MSVKLPGGQADITTVQQLADQLVRNADITLLLRASDLPLMDGHCCEHGQYVRDEHYLWGGGGYYTTDQSGNMVILPKAETAFNFAAIARGECICRLEPPEGTSEQILLQALFTLAEWEVRASNLHDILDQNRDARLYFQPAAGTAPVPVAVSYRPTPLPDKGLSGIFYVLTSELLSAVVAGPQPS